VTSLYGENPFHIREMNKGEFLDLLHAEFPNVRIYMQRILDSVAITADEEKLDDFSGAIEGTSFNARSDPLAFIALCSRRDVPVLSNQVIFDEASDYVGEFLKKEQSLNRLRFDVYSSQERVLERQREADRLHGELARLIEVVHAQEGTISFQAQEAERLKSDIKERNEIGERLTADLAESHSTVSAIKAELSSLANEIGALKQTRVFRLRHTLLYQPMSVRKVAQTAYLLAGLVTPGHVRRFAQPAIAKFRSLINRLPTPMRPLVPVPADGIDPPFETPDVESPASMASANTAYVVKHVSALPNAPRVVHVIANFMTGGSSRLVVDLIEHLGRDYRHSTITSFIPSPAAYMGLDIEECRFPTDEAPFIEYFRRVQADFVHVHYWGDCDEPWYAKAIAASAQLGLPVIENVNTPVLPYLSDVVVRYVYVSDYVRRVFGKDDPRHVTVYPGSDFSRFDRNPEDAVPGDCIGMVYRLERDKLNEQSIEPFILIAQRRPKSHILIVGGGTLLKPFQAAVKAAGVEASFEFTGYVSYEALPDLYRRISLLVTPVWKESFGQVGPFAMNMGVPVIGYDVGAIREIVGDSSLLAPAGNAESLADIAIRMLDNPQESMRVGRAQRARAQQYFSIQAMVRAYADIYADTCHERAKAK
jgi:glycosyltransferase involved in cell wall biosynthesis